MIEIPPTSTAAEVFVGPDGVAGVKSLGMMDAKLPVGGYPDELLE